jgi:hypothetical protein
MSSMKRSITLGAVLAVVAAVATAGAAFTYLPPAIMTTTVVQSAASTLPSTAAFENFTQQIASVYLLHLKNITSGNLTTMTSGYEHNATIEVSGSLMGPSIRPMNVSDLYLVLHQRFYSFNFKNLNYSIRGLNEGDEALLNSTLTVFGNGPFIDVQSARLNPGVYLSTLKLSVSYTRDGNNWLISNESWEFLSMNFCPTFSSQNCITG